VYQLPSIQERGVSGISARASRSIFGRPGSFSDKSSFDNSPACCVSSRLTSESEAKPEPEKALSEKEINKVEKPEVLIINSLTMGFEDLFFLKHAVVPSPDYDDSKYWSMVKH